MYNNNRVKFWEIPIKILRRGKKGSKWIQKL